MVFGSAWSFVAKFCYSLMYRLIITKRNFSRLMVLEALLADDIRYGIRRDPMSIPRAKKIADSRDMMKSPLDLSSGLKETT